MSCFDEAGSQGPQEGLLQASFYFEVDLRDPSSDMIVNALGVFCASHFWQGCSSPGGVADVADSSVAGEVEDSLGVGLCALADEAHSFEDGLAGNGYSPGFLASVLEGAEAFDYSFCYGLMSHRVDCEYSAVFFQAVASIVCGMASDQVLFATETGIEISMLSFR